MSTPERRAAPRIEVKLPLRLTMKDRTVETSIEDLSSSGIRFRMPAPLPLLSRVQIALELPDGKSSSKESASASKTVVALTGVVVRSETGQARKGYDTAIFFDEVPAHARGQLSRFMARKA